VILLTSLVIAVLFGCGVYLLLTPDLLKAAAGTVLLTNAAVLFILAAGFGAREEPLLPYTSLEDVADPLVQALAVTAIVIGFAMTALLLKVGLAVESLHGSIDLLDLRHLETREKDDAP
jgi:multicomponent Na+:H+ antiporter subunit C